MKRGFISGELDTWQPGTDCCFWLGVTCDQSRRVIGLNLAGLSIVGTIDPILFNLTSLETLNLSYNDFNQSIPDSGWERLENLSSLFLSWSEFTGKVPAGISHLTKMTFLDLSYNLDLSFTAHPTFLQNMSNLRELHLDFVNLSTYGSEWSGALANYTPALEMLTMQYCSLFGQLVEFSNALSMLTYVDLSNNNLQGQIPRSFFKISGLYQLDFSSNNFSGVVGSEFINLGDLNFLSLSDNILTEIPPFITYQHNHFTLMLSNNKLTGDIPTFICNLTNLDILDLSNNMLTGSIPPCLLERSSLELLPYLNSVSSSPAMEIPTLNYSLITLQSLDLSNNKLNGSIPPCLLERSSLDFFFYLNYSNNNLTGEIPTFICNSTYLQMLDFSNNKLNGSIPPCLLERSSLKNLTYLDLSKNNLIGEIPTFICNLTNLVMLDLSDNKLISLIPSCLFEEGRGLRVLNLRGNQLHGAIPHGVTPNCLLETINLRDNQLEGLLPRFLSNCRSLELLDLGNNNLNDVFPYWLGNISTLRVLILRSNKFHGLVWPLDGKQKTNYTFSALNVLDISSNNFSGNLCAKCFSNFKSMMINTTDVIEPFLSNFSDIYYSLVVLTIMDKGKLMTIQHFWKIIKSIDISNNNFEGEIPISIGQLVSLQVLNLSQNHMTGTIPPQLGNLLQLESLDLSMNGLSGKIPQELVSLHFLSFLNLSNNKLVGEIPSGGQFSTFPSTSFEGNKGLCWHPCNTSVPTVNNKVPPAPSLGGTTSENKSYKIVSGLLFGVGLGGLLAAVIVVDIMCCDRSMRWRSIRPHGEHS